MIKLSIQGPQAVGKTKVIKAIESRFRGMTFSYENPFPIVNKRHQLGLDISIEADFIENQRLFIEAEIKRYRALEGHEVIFDRGPEDTECYTLNYPLTLGNEWNVDVALETELRELRLCKIDRILYFDANPEILVKRCAGDFTRRRSSFNLKAFSIYKSWYEKQGNVDLINVTNLTQDEVISECENWISKQLTAKKELHRTPKSGGGEL